MADMFMYHNRLDDLYITDVTASSLGNTYNTVENFTWETRNAGFIDTNGYYRNEVSKTATVLRSRTYSIDFNRDLTQEEFNNIRIFASDKTDSSYNSNNVRSVREELTVTRSSTKNRIFIQKISDLPEVDIFWGTNTGFIIIVDIKGVNSSVNSYELNQNLQNCTSNISGSTIDESTDKEIILTCVDGFIFDEVPTITIGGNTLNFNLNNDLTVATVIVDIIDDVVINAVARKDIRVYITGTIINATCNYYDGEFLDTNKNIIISANSGTTFKGNYYYLEGSNIKSFINNENELLGDLSETFTNIFLEDNYNATKIVEQISNFSNLYITNSSELSLLSTKRFVDNDDYGSFINSLYILPFKLSLDMLGDKSNIILGSLDTKIESTLLNSYMYEFDGGIIEIPLKYNNIYDFVNTECILHLPFLNKVFLNSEYVIGQTLTITFTIELYSGNLTVNIISSFNNEIVASVQGLIGMNIPFIQKSNGNIINSVSNVYKNRNNRCFVEVNRNIPYTKNNNVFGGSVVEYGKIGDYTGYLECDSLVLNTKATNQEQEEIKNILRNGVFI